MPLTDSELDPGFTLKTNKSDQQSKQRFPFDSKGQKGRERGVRRGKEWKEGEKEEGEEESFAEGKVQSERKINDAQENKHKCKWKFKSDILVMFSQFPVFILITDNTHLNSRVQKERPCGCE